MHVKRTKTGRFLFFSLPLFFLCFDVVVVVVVVVFGRLYVLV